MASSSHDLRAGTSATLEWFSPKPGHQILAKTLLAIVLTSTLAAWYFTSRANQHIAKQRFENEVDRYQSLLRTRIQSCEQILLGAAALWSASDEVSRREWRAYAQRIQLGHAIDGTQGLGFVKIIPDGQQAAEEQKLQAELGPEYNLTPAGDHPGRTAVLYLEPMDARNRRAIGYDMFTEPTRREAMSRARDTGLPSLSGKVQLLEETTADPHPCVHLYIALYDKARKTENTAERCSALQGYVYAPLRMRDMMNQLLGSHAPTLRIKIYDGLQPNADSLLYDSEANLSPQISQALTPSRHRIQKSIIVAGRSWLLDLESRPNLEAELGSRHPTFAFLFGLTSSATAFSLILLLQRERKDLQARAADAARKSLEVNEFNRVILTCAPTAIIATDPQGLITTFNEAAEDMLGYTAHELIGQHTPALLHDPAELKLRASQFSAELGRHITPDFETLVARSRESLPNCFEWIYTRKDNTRLPVLLNITALKSTENTICGFLAVAQDITINQTLKRQREDSLRQVQQISRALDAHSIVGITDAKGRIIHANEKFLTTSKFSLEEILGRDFRIVSSGLHSKAFYQTLWTTIKAGKIWHNEICNKAKDGTPYWVDSTIIPVLTTEGRVQRYISISTDISELKKNVELLNNTQRQAKLGGWEYIVSTQTLKWSQELFHIHERRTDTPLSLEIATSYFCTEAQPVFKKALSTAIDTGQNFDLELQISTSSNNPKWVRITGQAHLLNNVTWKLSGTLQDIDEMKTARDQVSASELRYRMLTELSPIGIFESDPDGRYRYTNKRWQELSGLSQKNALNQGWIQSVHEEDKTSTLAGWNLAITTRTPFDKELRFTTPLGLTRWIHATAHPLYKKDSLIGFVGVCEDVTERRLAIEQMATSLLEKETLLKEIHHRVKNNLQMVSSLLSLQAGTVQDPTLLARLRESQDRIRSMALIHEMLYGGTSLASIDARTCLATLSGMVIRSHCPQGADIKIHHDLAPDIRLTPDKAIPLGLIANELLINAIKYGINDRKEGIITLKLCPVENEVKLRIADDGPGISSDYNPATATSLGLRLVRILSKQIEAKILWPKPGSPALYCIKFKL